MPRRLCLFTVAALFLVPALGRSPAGEKEEKKDKQEPPSLAEDIKALTGEWRRPADKGPYLRLRLLVDKDQPPFVDLGFGVAVHPDPEAKTKQVPQFGTAAVLKKEQGKRFLSLGKDSRIAYQFKGGKLLLEGKTPSVGNDPKDPFSKGLDLSGEWEKVEPVKKHEQALLGLPATTVVAGPWSASAAAEEPLGISGEWVGAAVNSDGDTILRRC